MVVELKIRKGRRTPPTKRLTYEQFLEWADEDTLAEWVDGRIEKREPESVVHQDLLGFVLRVLASFVEDHNAGEVMMRGYQMKLPHSGREPDVLFIAQKNLPRMTHRYLDAPADIVIEIASPESVLRDRGAKYGEYEAGGVREYWVFDPESEQADFFVLGGDGRYERAHPDADGVYHSAVIPEFWLDVNWLWRQPLPTLRQVLREWEKPR